ncbi:hypothetical protein B0H17DRAFT_1196225 [Mycena rosella]|uniref:Uncharacterized protein n=1 Tax=Mycena rosella TaxID=1033263 RepID=A0AAD7DWL1_MYCRO|nr:hypothetical protein B0H17DRAFT_1196225 [Mycena rosella]
MKRLEAISAFCLQNWQPSKQQVKLLKALLRHYMIRPITSYTNLVAIVETYVHDHAARLHLELFKQDPTVKSIVHELLTSENNNTRSAIRKQVFTSVKEKTALNVFSIKIVNSYHLPELPTKPPNEVKACLALMREVARPLIIKESARGGDTGSRSMLEKEVDKLFAKNGNKRDDPKWREWELEIIDADDRRYLRRGAEDNARTREDIDAAVLAAPAAAAASELGGAHAATSAAGNTDVLDAEADGEADGRDIPISGMGDLAALSAGSVARA